MCRKIPSDVIFTKDVLSKQSFSFLSPSKSLIKLFHKVTETTLKEKCAILFITYIEISQTMDR